MKEIFKNKWAWSVLILLVINIVTIAAVWSSMYRRSCPSSERENSMHHHRGYRYGHMHERFNDKDGNQHHDFLAQELNLSPEQKTSFKELQTAHFESMKKNMEEMTGLRKELMQNLGKSESDVEPIFQKISALELNNQKMLFKHFSAMYTLCTDSQKVLLKERLSTVMDHHKGGFSEGGMHRRGMERERAYRPLCKNGNCAKKDESTNGKMEKE